MTNDQIINWGSLLLFILVAGAIIGVIIWAVIDYQLNKEALPGFEEALEDRPDKLTAIVYGSSNNGETRYVPSPEVIEARDA